MINIINQIAIKKEIQPIELIKIKNLMSQIFTYTEKLFSNDLAEGTTKLSPPKLKILEKNYSTLFKKYQNLK